MPDFGGGGGGGGYRVEEKLLGGYSPQSPHGSNAYVLHVPLNIIPILHNLYVIINSTEAIEQRGLLCVNCYCMLICYLGNCNNTAEKNSLHTQPSPISTDIPLHWERQHIMSETNSISLGETAGITKQFNSSVQYGECSNCFGIKGAGQRRSDMVT